MPIAVFSNWLRRVTWDRILRGRHHGTRLWNCRRQITVANSPAQWLSWTWCRKLWNHSWRSSRVILNQRCFAFIRLRTLFGVRISCYFANSEPQRCFWLLPLGMNAWSSTHRASSRCWQFRFGNIVPKQWTMSGFVQYTSANSMYKDDNKISRNKKYCIWIKCLNVCHIFKQVLAQESNHCRNGEITAEAHNVYTTIHRSIVYFWYFRT